MASVDGSKSLMRASDELFDFVCGPCKSDQVDKEAKYFCQDCQEHLCDVCHDAHRKLKATKNHEILTGTIIPRPSTVAQQHSCVVYCSCNQNREVEIYCEDHKDVICNSCKTVKHRKCKTSTITDKSSGYTDASHTAILNKVKTLKNKLQQLQQERNADKTKIKRTKDACLTEIARFRKELNELLDKLEQNTIKDLDICANRHQSRAVQQASTLTTTFEMLDLDGKLLEEAQKGQKKETMFASNVKVTNTMKDYETVLADIRKETVRTEVSFERNKKVIELIDEIKTLGQISLGLHTTIGTREVQPVSQHTVGVSDDKTSQFITGSNFLPNGYLVVCDSYNGKIKLLDNTFTMKTSINLNACPWDVSVIDDNNVIVTVPAEKQLQFVQVSPQMKTGRVIQLDRLCYGVEVVNNEIYISCHNKTGEGEVRILDLKGNMKRRLGVDKDGSFHFVGPFYLTVNKSATKIYVSDYQTSIITCLAVTGETLYQYKDDELCEPETLFVDGGDNVVVCGRHSKTVQVITADGRKYKTLLSSSDGIGYPYSIAFRETDNMLVVGGHGNTFWCFKLSH